MDRDRREHRSHPRLTMINSRSYFKDIVELISPVLHFQKKAGKIEETES